MCAAPPRLRLARTACSLAAVVLLPQVVRTPCRVWWVADRSRMRQQQPVMPVTDQESFQTHCCRSMNGCGAARAGTHSLGARIRGGASGRTWRSESRGVSDQLRGQAEAACGGVRGGRSSCHCGRQGWLRTCRLRCKRCLEALDGTLHRRQRGVLLQRGHWTGLSLIVTAVVLLFRYRKRGEVCPFLGLHDSAPARLHARRRGGHLYAGCLGQRSEHRRALHPLPGDGPSSVVCAPRPQCFGVVLLELDQAGGDLRALDVGGHAPVARCVIRHEGGVASTSALAGTTVAGGCGRYGCC